MRRHPRSDRGFTMVEIMITSALMLAVIAMVLPLVAGSLNSFTDTKVRSDAVDNAQVALSQIGHDVVSANLLYVENPATTPIIHLQTYGNAGASTCVEYQVTYPAAPAAQVGVLQRRTKNPGSGSAWTAAWSSIMTGIVNSSRPAPVPSVLLVPSSSQYQSLVVNLWVQVDTRSAATQAAPENFTSTFTGPAIPANSGATATPTSEPC
jgi:prepilin-type N-terminal cleavage/methylation domain-containing protein